MSPILKHHFLSFMSFSCYHPISVFLIRTHLLGKIVYICSFYFLNNQSFIHHSYPDCIPAIAHKLSVSSHGWHPNCQPQSQHFFPILFDLCVSVSQATTSFLRLCHLFSFLLSLSLIFPISGWSYVSFL